MLNYIPIQNNMNYNNNINQNNISYLNNIAFSNNNNILNDIIIKLQNIVNDIYSRKQADIIVNQLKNIIIIINNITNKNNIKYLGKKQII